MGDLKNVDLKALKREYLTINLQDGEHITITDLAKRYGLAPQSLNYPAKRDGWKEELDKAREIKHDKIMLAVTNAVAKRDAKHLMGEVKVRVENYKAATRMLDPLLEYWDKRIKTPGALDKVSIPELISGISLCLKARSQAAGLADIIKVNGQLDFVLAPGEVPVEESKMKHMQFKRLAHDLRLELANKKGLPSREVVKKEAAT